MDKSKNRLSFIVWAFFLFLINLSLVNATWFNSSGDNQNKDYLAIDLEAGWNFDEVNSNITDIFNGINNGTNSAGVVQGENGLINKSIYLDGGNYPTFPAFHTADNFSISYSFWINWTSAGGDGVVQRLWSSQSEFDSYIAMSDSKITFIPRGGESFITNGAVSQNVWTHIVYTCNSSDKNQTVYINGAFDKSVINSYGCPVMITDIKFGVFWEGNHRFYAGLIDDAYFWDRTLNSLEVSDLYNSGNGLTFGYPAPFILNFTNLTGFDSSGEGATAVVDIWGNESTLFLLDVADGKVYQYLHNGTFISAITTGSARGLCGNSTTWLQIPLSGTSFVTYLHNGTEAGNFINEANSQGNSNINGIWCNATSILISDYSDGMIYHTLINGTYVGKYSIPYTYFPQGITAFNSTDFLIVDQAGDYLFWADNNMTQVNNFSMTDTFGGTPPDENYGLWGNGTDWWTAYSGNVYHLFSGEPLTEENLSEVYVTSLSPANGTKTTGDIINYTANISCNLGCSNATLYFFNATQIIYNVTTSLTGTLFNLGISINLSEYASEGTYYWYYDAVDTTNTVNTTENRTIGVDINPPYLTWNSPSGNIIVNTSTYSLNVTVNDTYLDAVNVTISNATKETYNNFTQNLTSSIFNVLDVIPLSEGINTVEVSARDSLTGSPKIIDKVSLDKKSPNIYDEQADIELDNGVIIRRTTYIIDDGKSKIRKIDYNLESLDKWDKEGKHIKTDITLDKLHKEDWGIRIDYECVAGCDGMLYLNDRGKERIIDNGRNMYFQYDDAKAEGWNIKYEQKDKVVSVYVNYPSKEYFNSKSGKQIIDPIAGGLNQVSENYTITLDTTAPVITIIFPIDYQNYSYLVNTLAYSYTELNCDSVWYSNNEGETNSSRYACGVNLTTFTAVNGNNSWVVWMNDTVGNIGTDSVTFNVDTLAPTFSGYRDNNGTIYNNGTGLFYTDVNNTNGTVYLHIDGNIIQATNLTNDTTYNVSYYFSSAGDYVYNWSAYGGGVLHTYGVSDTREFNVQQPIISYINYTGNTPVDFKNFSSNNFTVYVNVTVPNHTINEVGNIMKITIWNSTTSIPYINQIEPLLNWKNSTGSKQFHDFDYLLTSLKAGYKFDDLGDNVLDSITGRYNGTNTSALIKGETGIIGYSYNFSNPTIDSVYFNTGAYADEGEVYGNYSYSVWVYWTGAGGFSSQWIIGEDYLNLFINDITNGTVSFNKGGPDVLSKNPLTNNSWVNIIITCEEYASVGNVTMWFNGTLENSAMFGHCIVPDGRDVYLGRYKYSNNFNWGGLIDELYFWNKSLNSTEVQDVYNNGKGITISRDLGRRYPFANSNNQTFSLYSGSLANGTYYFNATFLDNFGTVVSTETREVDISDIVSPNITYIAPANDTYSINQSVNFTINASDIFGLNNATLTINNQTGIYNQTTVTLGGIVQTAIGIPIYLIEGIYSWFYNIFDMTGNLATTETRTYTVDITTPYYNESAVGNLYDGINISQSNLPINLSVTESNLANVTYILYSDAGITIVNQTTTNTTYFNWVNVPDGHYWYKAIITDKANNQNETPLKSATLDVTPTVINQVLFGTGDEFYVFDTNTLTFNFSVKDTTSGIVNTSIKIYDRQSETYANITTFSSGLNLTTTNNISIPITLPDGLYTWKVEAYDYADNYADPDENITIDTEYPQLSILSPANNTGYNATSFTVVANGSDLTEQYITFRLFNSSGQGTSTHNTSSPYKINAIFNIYSDGMVSTLQNVNDSNQVTYGNATITGDGEPYIDIKFKNITFNLGDGELNGDAIIYYNFTTFNTTGNGQLYTSWNHCYQWNDSSVLYGLSGLVPPPMHYTGNYFQKEIIPTSCINPVTNEVRFRIEWFSGHGTYGRLYEIWINYNITQPLQQYTYTDGTRSQLFSGLPYEGKYYFDVSMRDADNRVNTTALYKVYLDFTAPTGQSGGYSGSGTSPANKSYTNQSAVNFTINASDVGGIGNVTLTIINESNDIINTTTVTFPEKPTSLFFGIIYYLWYEGFYRWYYTIMDAVGFSVTSTEAVVTYDITDPNSIINYPINTTYNHVVTHLDYTYTEANCNDTWLVAGSTYYDGCGSTYIGLASVEQNNTWTLYIRDKAGNVNSSFISFTQDTIPPTVIFTNRTEPNNTFFGNYRTWIFVEVNHSEPIDLYNLTYRLSKVGTGTINTTSYTIPTLPKTINWTGLTDGVYTYYVEVCDLYANCNRTDTRTLYLDNIPPVITFPAGQIVNVSAIEFPINISFQYNITDNNNQLKECWYKIDLDGTNGTYVDYNKQDEITKQFLLGTARNETSKWFMYRRDNLTSQIIYEFDIASGSLLRTFNVSAYESSPPAMDLAYDNGKLIIGSAEAVGYSPLYLYYPNGTYITSGGGYGNTISIAIGEGDNKIYNRRVTWNNLISVNNITTLASIILGECGGDNRTYFDIEAENGDEGDMSPIFIYNGYLYVGYGSGIFKAYNYKNITCDGTKFVAREIPQFNKIIEGVADSLYKTDLYRPDNYDLTLAEMTTFNSNYFGSTNRYRILDANYLLYKSGYYNFIECNSNTTAPVFHEGMQLIAVYGMDNASNTNYSILEYYVLYHEYEQNSSVGDTTVEGEIVTYNLNVTMTDLTPTSAQFIYNGVSYPADSFSVAGNQYQFTIDFTIPDGAGNTTGKLAQWYWNYSIENYFEGYETEPQNQIVYSVEIDNCTLYDEVVLNLYQLNDEETDTLMNETLNPKIEVDVKLISQGNPDVFWEYSTLFNSINGSICIPSVILNYTDYYLDIVIGFSADTYVNEFWYLDKGNVSQDSFWFDDYTSRNVTLRDLLADDSTSFLFTFYDENYLTQPNAIVTVLRKYINEGVFKEVERSKQDDNGQTLMHLVQEDVIYKFRVTLDGELLYESGEYTAKCVETPCSITLQKGTETVEIPDESERDNLPAGTYSISVDRSNRTATLSFNLNETGDMSFAIYTTGNNPNQYTLIDSDTVTSKSGTLTVYVPQTYDNQTFLASVRHNDMYVVDEWIDFTRSAYDIFGAMGLFLGAILVLTLGLIAVSHGGWTIVFIILGLIISMIAHLIDLDFYTLMWIICAGGLIVWKLSTRRTI